MQLYGPLQQLEPKEVDFDGSESSRSRVDVSVGVHVTPSLHPHAAGEFASQAALEKEGWIARAGKTR